MRRIIFATEDAKGNWNLSASLEKERMGLLI
jgi:hypothetical protein